MEELLEVKARIKILKDRYVELHKALNEGKDARWIYSMNNLGVEAMKGLVNKMELELKWKIHNEKHNERS
jgi:hypothetical protein